MSDAPVVRLVLRHVEHFAPRTDVLIAWRGRNYLTRHNYPLADTPANRQAEARAFLSRQSSR